MRNLFRLATLLSVAFLVLFITSCDPDTPGTPGGVTLPPVVTLNTGAGLVAFNQEVSLSTPNIIVSISGEDGDAALRSLRIEQNGALIPASNLTFRTGQTANNPILILGDDTDGFTYEVEIRPTNPVAGDVTFGFVLADADGETASTSVIVTYTASPPTADLLIQDGFVSGDATITSSTPSFRVRLQYAQNEAAVETIEVLENGALIDASRLSYNNGAFTAANPLTLVDAERTGGTFEIGVTPNVTTDETRTYTFRVTDADGQVAERTVNVSFVIPARDLEFEMNGVFFNASGRMLGGLDLDNGTAVTFNSADAEIEDEGVNLDDNRDEKWRAQISATNDAVLRIANLTTIGDGVTFNDVQLKSDIAAAFDQGNGVLGGDDNVPNTDGDNSRNEIVTTRLVGGEVFAVRRGTRTYLVRIDEVNYVAGSNNDSYSVSIKY